MDDKVQYAPWSSDIELGFYAALASLKINHDKLDDSARKVLGLYEVRPSDKPERSCRMQITGSCMTTDEVPAGYYRAEGIIKNVNTIEEYKNLDRSAVVERAGRTIWDAINDGTIYSCPSLLASFSAISFADLKKYKFTYHFAFPALHSEPQWRSVEAQSKLSPKETTSLVDQVQTWRYSVDSRQHGYFIAKRVRPEPPDDTPRTPGTPGALEELGFYWVVGSLSTFENGFFEGVEPEDRFVCFADPSTYASNPGWPLRNLLVLMRQRWRVHDINVISYRDTHLRRDQSNSIILHLKSEATDPLTQLPKATGWERNDNGKLTSRFVDLSEYMDPTKLADQAVDLNLKLIKWRIAPGVDLDVIKDIKCLLLGAGTLGAYVSRNLMGWGVRKITFVDNATVSFSNPVRQPLFDFKDCLEGGTKKAYRAAEALSEIYPGIDSEGHVMSVPMAGHPITDENKTKAEFEKLRALIEQHDVLFLLMDTRESRWLPTVMGKAAGKIVMNAALGFDTFVVMRQGLKAYGPGEEELGCYFCNDVVAPADSLKDATLDQQCTVTRPGIAPIASALLVELMVSILQHPLRSHAPAATSATTRIPITNKRMGWNHPNPHLRTIESDPSIFPRRPYSPSPPPEKEDAHTLEAAEPSQKKKEARPNSPSASEGYTTYTHPLGALPHTLRGFLSNWDIRSFAGKPYDCCSACSDKIISLYKKDGWEFVKRAINEKGWVEEISGLAEVQRRAEEAMKDLDDDDDEIGGDFGEDEEGELL